jgi:putative ABC transport system permease protein
MIKNYIKVALRTLTKNKFFSLINIFGLALSMSICLILFMLIADQKNNDAYNTDKDKIYRVIHDRVMSGDLFTKFATTPLPLAEKLVKEYDDVEYAVRIRKGFGNDVIEFDNDLNIPVAGFFVDPEFLDLFQYNLMAGNPASALSKPNSVVLKEQIAQKLFGSTDVIGNIITVGDQGDYIVTGIIEDNGEQSHIKFDALASLATLSILEEQDSVLYPTVNNWENRWAGFVYFKIKDNVSLSSINEHLEIINKEIYADLEEEKPVFELQALGEITPGPLLSNEIGPVLPWIFVYFFAGIALLVMVSAAFNYMNLSIARALTRAREVGIRKVSGATRKHLIIQFLAEAIILALIALVASYGIMLFLKPAFTQLHFSELLKWDLRLDYKVVLLSVAFSIGVGLLAGIVPALTLSSFHPSQVLKQLQGIKLFSKIGLRKALIISQFSLSLVFIISATLVYNQLQLMLGADFGFRTDEIVNVRLNNTSYKQLRLELEKYPQIATVSASSHIPASGETKSTGVKLNLEDDIEYEMRLFRVDENYLKLFDLELVAGKNFTTLDPDAHEVIVNEKCVEEYKLGNPSEAIGKYFIDANDSTNYKIVGVVKNYYHQMLVLELTPMMLLYKPESTNIAHVRMAGNNKEEFNAIIDKAYANVNPGYVIDRQTMEEELAFYYDFLFGDLSKITGLATALALVIACLGLLGMATYTIETRTKEVGIRKVLGASEKQLVYHLSRGFISILIISIIVAVPLAYLLNDLWLQLIAVRVDITLGVLGFGVLILLVLGVITIGSQTYRATTINPVDSLRSE